MALNIKKTILTIEVLSDVNDNPSSMDIANVIEESINGGFSMQVINGGSTILNGKEAIKACNDQGTDPYFFVVEDENLDND